MGNGNRIVFLAAAVAAGMLAGCCRSSPSPASAYIANRASHIVHRADCKAVASMKPANRVSFDHLADALAEGYKPCHYCLRSASTKPAIAAEEKP